MIPEWIVKVDLLKGIKWVVPNQNRWNFGLFVTLVVSGSVSHDQAPIIVNATKAISNTRILKDITH